jgi:hypothetical protein
MMVQAREVIEVLELLGTPRLRNKSAWFCIDDWT